MPDELQKVLDEIQEVSDQLGSINQRITALSSQHQTLATRVDQFLKHRTAEDHEIAVLLKRINQLAETGR